MTIAGKYSKTVIFAIIVLSITSCMGVLAAQPSNIGIFRPSTHLYYRDFNGNGAWDGPTVDRVSDFGVTGDLPLSGDWNNDGITEIGVYRPSNYFFYRDFNGNGVWDGGAVDRVSVFGTAGDLPVSGDWNDDGTTEISIFRPSTAQYYRDYNGNGAWDGPATDRVSGFGIAGDLPVSGDWNGNGVAEIGVYRPSTSVYYRDYNGNGNWDGPTTDRSSVFGINGDVPISGDWNTDGITEIGIFRPSSHIFYEDYNGNGVWNGALTDRSYSFGITGDSPATGKWAAAPPQQTEYKVYAEVGVDGPAETDKARDFWTHLQNYEYGSISWSDSGHGFLVGEDNVKLNHWTTNAGNYIGQADFLYYSGEGIPEGINFTDDDYQQATADTIRLNSTGKTKWVVFDSCNTLKDDTGNTNAEMWVPAFSYSGLHMILGWNSYVTPSTDGNYLTRGEVFYQLMKGGYPDPEYWDQHLTVHDAWTLTGIHTYSEHPGQSDEDVMNAIMYMSDANGDNGCLYENLPGLGITSNCNPSAWNYVTYVSYLILEGSNPGGTSSLDRDTESIKTTDRSSNGTIWIYKAVTPAYDKEQIILLARNLGLSGDIRESPEAFFAADNDTENYYFFTNKNSSINIYMQLHPRQGTKHVESVPELNAFLHNVGLLSSKNAEPRVINEPVMVFTRSGALVSSRIRKVYAYPQMIDGLRVLGSQFNVEVDSDGTLTRIFRNWQDFTPDKEIPLISPEEALDKYRSKLQSGPTDKIVSSNMTDVTLCYQLTQSAGAEYLEPVYVFRESRPEGNGTESIKPLILAASGGIAPGITGNQPSENYSGMGQ
jgi:hypothetical protein